MTDQLITDALDALYDELPELQCVGKCWPYCRAIRMSEAEQTLIERKLGHEIPDYPEDGRCPLLSADGGCTVYEARPATCRAWGTSVVMPCDWGCQPSRPFLTEAETQAFLQRSLELGGGEAEAHKQRLVRLLQKQAARR